jgi:hypothetical protein
MRAILVSVNYSDILSITLPYNRCHFDDMYVVTSSDDAKNVIPIADSCNAKVLVTDLFYAHGPFCKWLALEWALDQMGRHGWLTVMDADILWPSNAGEVIRRYLTPGFLITPLRRMFTDITKPLPPENKWNSYPIHRNVQEWAGYSQTYHANDPVLGTPPWHDTSWVHCGGSDSFFQMKWPKHKKIRPNFHCLHIGDAGQNWFGRATPLLDGTIPDQAEERREMVRQMWINRRKVGRGRFEGEKLGE